MRYMPAMTNKRNQRDFVNGVPELLLLRLLSHRPMYGYELVQAIRHATDQALDFGEGCVYPLLHRLESQQMLSGAAKLSTAAAALFTASPTRGIANLTSPRPCGNVSPRPSIKSSKENGMDSQPLFDRLRKELAQRGLPPRYIKRVVRELRDHQEDIQEEPAAAGNFSGCEGASLPPRLGEPIRLAEAIAAEFRSATFVGRHPAVTFLTVPIPLTFLAWLCFTILFGMAMGSFKAQEQGRGTLQWSPPLIWCGLTLYYATLVLPSALAAWLCCRWAYRSGRGTWSVAGFALIAIFAGSMATSIHLSAIPFKSWMGVGSVLLIPFVGHAGVDVVIAQQLMQMAAPLGIMAFFFLRQRRQLRKVQLVEG